jgi:copper chaperone CopZ
VKTIIACLGFLVASFAAQAQFRNFQLQAAGLTCSMCSNAINKALKTIPAIKGIETDLKNNLFLISFKEDADIDFDLIGKKVEEAGFSVGRLTMEVNFSNARIANDQHISVQGKVFHFLGVKNQTLQGWTQVQLVDEHFVLAKQYKKIRTYTGMECLTTGVAGNCCKMADAREGQRIYHITI